MLLKNTPASADVLRIAILCAHIFAATDSEAAQADAEKLDEQPARVLFIIAKDSTRSNEELARLQKPHGEFDTMRAYGWRIGITEKDHLQIVDYEDVPELVLKLEPLAYPVVAAVKGGEIVRYFKSGCTTPLDAWTFGWLAKGKNERPRAATIEPVTVETTGHYPLRGNHWTIDGDSNPSRATVLTHLRGPNHAHQAARYASLDAWSLEELRSLHDNLHELEMGGMSGSSRTKKTDTMSAIRKSLGRI
jgi:hypothetical protein